MWPWVHSGSRQGATAGPPASAKVKILVRFPLEATRQWRGHRLRRPNQIPYVFPCEAIRQRGNGRATGFCQNQVLMPFSAQAIFSSTLRLNLPIESAMSTEELREIVEQAVHAEFERFAQTRRLEIREELQVVRQELHVAYTQLCTLLPLSAQTFQHVHNDNTHPCTNQTSPTLSQLLKNALN